jgi:hypothetical protein
MWRKHALKRLPYYLGPGLNFNYCISSDSLGGMIVRGETQLTNTYFFLFSSCPVASLSFALYFLITL